METLTEDQKKLLTQDANLIACKAVVEVAIDKLQSAGFTDQQIINLILGTLITTLK